MSSVWPTTLWVVLWSGHSAQLFPPWDENSECHVALEFLGVKVEPVMLSLYHRAAVRTDSAMPLGGAVADGTSKADREGRQQKSEVKRLDEEWKTFGYYYAQSALRRRCFCFGCPSIRVTEVRLHCISHLKDHVTSIRDQRRSLPRNTLLHHAGNSMVGTAPSVWKRRCSCVAFSVPGHNAALALHTLPRKSVFETLLGHQ